MSVQKTTLSASRGSPVFFFDGLRQVSFTLNHSTVNFGFLFIEIFGSRFLLSHPNLVPDGVGPIVNLLRDCGLCTPTLTLYKTSVVAAPKTSLCLLLALYITMHRFNG